MHGGRQKKIEGTQFGKKKKGTQFGKKKKGTQFGERGMQKIRRRKGTHIGGRGMQKRRRRKGTQFGERVGHGDWLIGPKLFRPEALIRLACLLSFASLFFLAMKIILNSFFAPQFCSKYTLRPQSH